MFWKEEETEAEKNYQLKKLRRAMKNAKERKSPKEK